MQLVGLARRAGAVAPGVEAVREAVREGEARLVLLADDASPAQLDKVGRTLAGRPVPTARLGDRAMLGTAVGLGPISALAVTEASLAGRVVDELGDLVVGEPAAAAADAVDVDAVDVDVDSVGAER
jgi:ribosomal protein L7Ae-like RNA K-turn-binding protein